MQANPIPGRRIVHIVGGGTISDVRSHLHIGARAYGTTARRLAELCGTFWPSVDIELHLTRMADPASRLETNDDLRQLAAEITADYRSKVVIWSPAIADFSGTIQNESGSEPEQQSGRYTTRLRSNRSYLMELTPNDKLVGMFRSESVDGKAPRKDIFLVAFKTTTGASEQEMYSAGLALVKKASCNLVLVNDTVTRMNMVVTPEEASYHVTSNRDEALRGLLEMTYLRSQLTFTRSTVVAGDPVEWCSDLVYPTLRAVVDRCIEEGAYKPFMGVTAGHFAAKIDENVFLTSRRKTNFNHLSSIGLVRVTTDGPDSVIAEGSKPSVGGQSQRIVFAEHPEYDCIVHFHCPIKEGSVVPVVSQRAYECGSHECGQNTSSGLRDLGFGSGILGAVYLDQHGPNIVFNHEANPDDVMKFILDNFDLTKKTGGYVPTNPLGEAA
jgi:hypothetical protein